MPPWTPPAPAPISPPAPIPNIEARVPVRLERSGSTYYAWKTYFGLVFREYYLTEHIDGSVDAAAMGVDPEWSAIEATLVRWFYQTISRDIFHMVVADGDSAHTVWTKINALFTNNKLQRVVLLQQEFFGCHQDESTIEDYCMRLKMLADPSTTTSSSAPSPPASARTSETPRLTLHYCLTLPFKTSWPT